VSDTLIAYSHYSNWFSPLGEEEDGHTRSTNGRRISLSKFLVNIMIKTSLVDEVVTIDSSGTAGASSFAMPARYC
jgi:hypothetical protein